jgi:hypothetical protein
MAWAASRIGSDADSFTELWSSIVIVPGKFTSPLGIVESARTTYRIWVAFLKHRLAESLGV